MTLPTNEVILDAGDGTWNMTGCFSGMGLMGSMGLMGLIGPMGPMGPMSMKLCACAFYGICGTGARVFYSVLLWPLRPFWPFF